MPGAGFKREAFRIRELVRNMMDTPYEMVRSAMVSPSWQPVTPPAAHTVS